MGKVSGLGVEASRWQCFERAFIELLAVAHVPGAGQDGHLAIVRVRMRGELVSSREFQTDRIGAGLRRIAHEVRLLDAAQRQAALRFKFYFCGRYSDGLRFDLSMKPANSGGKYQATQHKSQGQAPNWNGARGEQKRPHCISLSSSLSSQCPARVQAAGRATRHACESPVRRAC